jgi:phenylacetic acid degradation operon negative regulatory protein
VLATALLGAPNGSLPVSHLVQAARLFGIADGTVRSCLSRMVANGELATTDGVYELSGALVERRHDVDGAVRPRSPDANWDGRWEVAVVRAASRSAAERHELRVGAARLRLGALRDGCWMRPDNLDNARQPQARSVIEQQCLTFHGTIAHASPADIEQMFGLIEWASEARRIDEAIDSTLAEEVAQLGAAQMRRHFLLLIAAARHLRADATLPDPLLPHDWPGEELRAAYDRLAQTLRRRLDDAVTSDRTTGS